MWALSPLFPRLYQCSRSLGLIPTALLGSRGYETLSPSLGLRLFSSFIVFSSLMLLHAPKFLMIIVNACLLTYHPPCPPFSYVAPHFSTFVSSFFLSHVCFGHVSSFRRLPPPPRCSLYMDCALNKSQRSFQFNSPSSIHPLLSYYTYKWSNIDYVTDIGLNCPQYQQWYETSKFIEMQAMDIKW